MPPLHQHSLFRSEEMVLCQFFFQDEVAYACVEALGSMELVQFQDLNHDVAPREKPYFAELTVLQQVVGILQVLEEQIKRQKREIAPEDDKIPTPIPGDLMDIKDTLEKFNTEVGELDDFIKNLKRRHDETIEIATVMDLSKKYLKTAMEELKEAETQEPDPDVEEGGGRRHSEMKTMQIHVMGGVMQREKFSSFERTLWRASRGKAFVKFEHIDYEFQDVEHGSSAFKTGFIIFFQGEKLNTLAKKIADGFRAKMYPIPDDTNAFDRALTESKAQRKDLDKIIRITEKQFQDLLDICAENLETWYAQVLKMKAVYVQLNQFTTKPHIGEGWVPLNDLPDVRLRMVEVAKEAGGLTEPLITITDCEDEPPTYFWTDKFTKGFQALIDAYGIATYKEVNPMPYTTISFPYLFSMMFGDLGHGSLLFLFGLTMILREKKMLATKSKNEIRNIMFGGRYIIFMMGIFSMYSGSIYNDCFGTSLNIFGSSWILTQDFNEIRQLEIIELDPAVQYCGAPYPFGMDPTWEAAKNKIMFLNSFKMKISVIFGVIQMVFGLFLSLWNDWFFAEYWDIVLIFVPQILFMCFIFGWLCVLVVFKWFAYGAGKEYVYSPTCAPSVLIHFINMILHKDMVVPEGCNKQMFARQFTVQNALFIIAVICIPWLFLGKPMVIIYRIKKEREKELLEQRRLMQKKLPADASKTGEVKHEIEGSPESGKSEKGEGQEEDQKEEEQNKTDDEKDKTENEEDKIEKEEDRTGKGEGEPEKEKTEKKGDQEDANQSEKGRKSVKIAPTASEHKKKRGKKQSMGEIFIHQGIVTIEYILGTISHTASYLRLWALSLAHAQLSNVLWVMVLSNALRETLREPEGGGFILLFVVWAIWAVLTIAILVLMEGLSAFLHTLRLHWVEFNSKFYTGLGYSFTPFSFRQILSVERA